MMHQAADSQGGLALKCTSNGPSGNYTVGEFEHRRILRHVGICYKDLENLAAFDG
jgi:hypothetical protein